MFTEHKRFYILVLISLIPIVFIGIFYNYYSGLEIKFILKPIPILILILDIFIYFIIYGLNIYPLLTLMVLLFCLIGDILLMFYIPTIPEYNNKLFLVIGGFSFFVARLIISVNFYIYPYRNKQIYISLNVRQFSVGLIISLVYTIFFSFFFTIKIENLVMRIFICFYILLTGFQLFSSIIRINAFKDESLLPQLLGVLFTVCFNISDIILFWNIFLTPLHAGENVAICFYWLSMYLLTISIVRNKSYTIEKNDIFLI